MASATQILLAEPLHYIAALTFLDTDLVCRSLPLAMELDHIPVLHHVVAVTLAVECPHSRLWRI
jgi:hypothetical protein